MKTKNIPYNEAKQLLLQGVCIKLPEWEGYWKFDTEEKQIFAHLKCGGIAPAQAIYTFNENWEIATVDNCPVLKREMEAKLLIANGEILKVFPIRTGGRNDLMILFKSVGKIVEVNHGALCDLVGVKEAKRLIRNYMEEQLMSDLPEGAKAIVRELFKSLDEASESIVDEIKKEMKKEDR